MKIINIKWTYHFNKATIKCDCRNTFACFMHRWAVRCPNCHSLDNIERLRKEYVQKGD